MSKIDLVSKNLLANFFCNCRKRNNGEKITSENHLQISQNRRNNKSNKNQDLGKKKEAKKDPEIAKVTRIFLAS